MQKDGLSAIVTGGATGLGAAVSQLLSSEGAKVTILGRRAELVTQRAKEINGLGIPCDVTDERATEKAFDTAKAAHGPVRILVNSAAITRAFPLISSTCVPASLADMAELISINLLGTLNTVRLAALEMASIKKRRCLKGRRISFARFRSGNGAADRFPLIASARND